MRKRKKGKHNKNTGRRKKINTRARRIKRQKRQRQK
jgi:hypothetical protein